MKILKIALQNINSLKSDTPIVIDFESEKFKDVGLFAITGATGAGKTTILDAITIALYHSVPRFNNAKGSLLDVVSYGATEAFSRLTFVNEQNIYEAYWGIRLASSTGKLLANPQEEVSLKNLSTETILANQKRAVLTEVVQVTQLDYDQFLRSVLLAQGEFASFLNAKGPEKGRLLEQITGEQIYKKIGQAVLDRKFKEEQILKEIQSEINAIDLLSDEARSALIQKEKELNLSIETAEKKLIAAEKIRAWYVDSQKLQEQATQLTQESEAIQQAYEQYKTAFSLLDLHEKAAPFAGLLQELKSTEKRASLKKQQLQDIQEALKLLDPEIKRVQEQVKQEALALGESKKSFEAWLPKLETITQLDAAIQNEVDNHQKIKESIASVEALIAQEKDEQKRLNEKQKECEAQLKNSSIFVTENSFLQRVASEISSWNSAFIQRQAFANTLQENAQFSAQKKQVLGQAEAALTETKTALQKKQDQQNGIEKDLRAVQKQLKSHNLRAVLAKKHEWTSAEATWKELQHLVAIYQTSHKEFQNNTAQHQNLSSDLSGVKEQLVTLGKALENQEKSVADAQRILDLEKSIAKYEADRQNLVDGEPCALCGSKEHPFIAHLQAQGVSASETIRNSRKEQLLNTKNAHSALEKEEVKLTTSIESLQQQLKSNQESLSSIKAKVKQLNVQADITSVHQIDAQLATISSELKVLDEQLELLQQLQAKNDAHQQELQKEKAAMDVLNTSQATLLEKIQNIQAELATKETANKRIQEKYSDLEKELSTELVKFNYSLPSVAEAKEFMKAVEASIAQFQNAQKKLGELKAEHRILKNGLENQDKQIQTHAKTKDNYLKAQAESTTKSTELKAQRAGILPLEQTVEYKRSHLQKNVTALQNTLDQRQADLQKLWNQQREKEAVKLENSKEQKVLEQEQIQLHSSLNRQLAASDFDAKEALENALLPEEVRQAYAQNKKQLEEQQLRLQTLKETYKKTSETLEQSKTFTRSEAESQAQVAQLKIEKDQYLALKGELKEAFRKDEEIRTRNQATYKKIEAQEATCKVWKTLYALIGNSKDAFNVYVQRLTLKQLLDRANLHLYQLNKRYSLKMEEDYKPKEELNFNLIDHYQTDQARLVDTSSGGEKFIISLALALGLSDLASKNVKIGSLFIDEGFGTLDKNSLETVISTLETLQSQGKMIGIISHVENLKERISTQIQITKKSNGVSTLEIL